MKALLFHEHGGLDQVVLDEIPERQCAPEEVCVRIQAAALNRLDLWVLEGWPGLRLKLPHIMGSDGAGIVVEVGDAVTDFAPGDRVAINPTLSCGRCAFCRAGKDNMCRRFALLGEHVDGLFAEQAVLPARNLLHLPEGIPFTAAAAAALVFVTAWHSLITRGQLRAGESVLIVGAGGGVNSAAIQVARFAGAKPIYVVGSSPAKLALALELGADVTINRQEQDWGKAVFEATAREGVDVVVDNVGAATFHTSLRSLKRGGRLLTVGNTSGPQIQLDNRLVFGKQLTVIGSTMGPAVDYAKVMELLFAGHLRAVIDRTYSLHEGRQALQHLRDGDVLGKVILEP